MWIVKCPFWKLWHRPTTGPIFVPGIILEILFCCLGRQLQGGHSLLAFWVIWHWTWSIQTYQTCLWLCFLNRCLRFSNQVIKGYFPIPKPVEPVFLFFRRHLSQTWILFMSVIWSILKILEHHCWVRNVLEAFSHSPVHLFLPHHLMIESYKEYVEISNAWWSTVFSQFK